MGAAGIESPKNCELTGVSAEVGPSAEARPVLDTGAKSADFGDGAKPPCEKSTLPDASETSIEGLELSTSTESGIALIESRDNQIRTLAVAVDAMLAAGLFVEARALSARLRTLVEMSIPDGALDVVAKRP